MGSSVELLELVERLQEVVIERNAKVVAVPDGATERE